MTEEKLVNTTIDEGRKTALRKELEELLDGFKDAGGTIPKGLPYLKTEKGKRILQIVVDLALEWPNVEKLLGRSKSTIEKSLSNHKVRRPRPDHISWTPERLAVIEKYYAILSRGIKTRKDSAQLSQEMLQEVNKLPGDSVTLNAIRCVGREKKWKWGWQTNKDVETQVVKKTINAYIEKSISEGILKEKSREDGLAALHDKVREEFPDNFPDKKAFRKRVEQVLWEESPAAKKRDKALQEIVRMGLDVETEFCQRFPNIPKDWTKTRERWHRGVVTTKTQAGRALPGIGRIRASVELGDLSRVQIPQTSFNNPLNICPTAKQSEDFTIMFLNGANIGTRYGRDIVGNVVRRALSDADEFGDKAVILTNIIALDIKKAGGPIKIGRGLVMGDNINPNIFADPEYRAEVERIIKENPRDAIIYQNSEELLDNVLSGWTKVSTKPDQRPEYTGPILIILGANEEELIWAVAYWEINYWTKRKQQELNTSLRVAGAALKEAMQEEDDALIAALQDEIDILQEQRNRTAISNVATQEQQRFYEQARALVVRKIEQAIPNSKVIGQGTTHLSIAGKKIEACFTGYNGISDALLAKYSGEYGPKNLREQLADATVICHPWALQFRMTVREADYNGKRGSAKMFVAPITVDDTFLRMVLKPTVRKMHPLAQAVFNEKFKSGTLRLHCTNGVIDADILSVESLEAFKKYPKPRKNRKQYAQGSKYIWCKTGTDQHWGGRAKEFVTCRLPGARFGMRLGLVEATFEMMRNAGATEKNIPFHIFASNDDGGQGQNYHYRTEPDPHQRSFNDLEKEFLKMLEKAKETTDTETLRTLIERTGRVLLHGLEKRGSDFPQEQMFQMINRHVLANKDIFNALLKRHLSSGITIKGVGEFGNAEYGGHDTRNVGVINLPSGNHIGNTVDNEIVEGPFYEAVLEAGLSELQEWRGKEDLLRQLVAAPLYGSQTMAWGTIKAPNGYEYGLDLRATPPRMAGWADPLLGAVRNDPLRGNYSRIFNGRLTLKTYGDKHFFAAVSTSYAFYHMSASGTHTDPYGERGFPPNNSGVSFVGLPADGPESGPILLRILPYDVIRDFVEDNPRPFDWEAFLPNPV